MSAWDEDKGSTARRWPPAAPTAISRLAAPPPSRSSGCARGSRDLDAGARAYTSSAGNVGAYRFWLGFYNQSGVDTFTGAPMAMIVDSASRQEYDIYLDLYAQLEANLGHAPQTIVADKGFAVAKVYEHNTRRGVATVTPRRSDFHDTVIGDRHGIPRCPHCGSETTFVRFAHRPSPRVWFTCNGGLADRCAPQAPGSKKPVLSRACSADWRRLTPLWATDPVYQSLMVARNTNEHPHLHWRDRYRVAGDSLANRPKRVGISCQQLRATAPLVIEWLRICARHGWLPGTTRTYSEPLKNFAKKGKERLERLLAERRDFGLGLAYGPAAVAAGVTGPDVGIPPSRRRKHAATSS